MLSVMASEDFQEQPRSSRGERAAAAFVSHGSPLLALDRGGYARAMRELFSAPRPEAVVVLSAHWQTAGLKVTSSQRPPLLHDFGGFPPELYALDYPTPGAPVLAEEIARRLLAAGMPIALEPSRGLDHGVWIPLRLGRPEADVPVLQLSLPHTATPESLLALGRALAPLREEGVLLLGSGGLVHNLGTLSWDEAAPPSPWALDFDSWVAERIQKLDIEGLVTYRAAAPHASSAAPSTEHFAPLFFAMGAALPGDHVATIFEGFQHQNLSLRSFALRAVPSSPTP